MAKNTVKETECAGKITPDMTFKQILDKCPGAGEIMQKYHLHCVHCSVAATETFEQGMEAHGLTDAEKTKLLEEINKLCK
ncbi:MAG: DUF1858 domain-containing protein [Nanoarchaeota archaeon]|nr:DUF1858 domain-containing protein [Nanoarchaeota archaeon]